MSYKRQDVGKYIIKALQSLGGSATRQTIKEEIVADDSNKFSYDDVFGLKKSKTKGTLYCPFTMDFNFSLVNLYVCGYIADHGYNDAISLTEKGRTLNFNDFPSEMDMALIDSYWNLKKQERESKKKMKVENIKQHGTVAIVNNDEDTVDSDEEKGKEWKLEVLECIKNFSPKKFESFSRLLFSQMGIKFDSKEGIRMSGDHGIDGYGFFESDEFRTSRVVIQCKKYTDNPVSEPEIDKIKGAMTSYNADYGIFITTSYFTKQAITKATQGQYVVTLIDGHKLMELIEKYQLHITPTYILNNYYFQKD